MNDENSGNARARIKLVRKRLADGTIKTYTYDMAERARQRFVARRSHALHQLARLYFDSPEFAAHSPGHQRTIRNALATAEDALGWMTLDDLENHRARGEFYKLRDGLRETPAWADRVVVIIASLLSWAYERGHVSVNHAARMERLVTADASRVDRIWTDEHVTAYLAAARADVAIAFQFALYTATRVSDMMALRADQLEDGWLTFVPEKTRRTTRVVVSLPVNELAPLRELLRDAPREGQLLRQLDGRPWHESTLKKWHQRAMAAAGITDDLHWHDLRGTAVSRMLAAGCTDAEVASISGHALIGPGAGRAVALGLRAYAARMRPLAVRAYRAWDRMIAAGETANVIAFPRAAQR